jgi:hypothetical protein
MWNSFSIGLTGVGVAGVADTAHHSWRCSIELHRLEDVAFAEGELGVAVRTPDPPHSRGAALPLVVLLDVAGAGEDADLDEVTSSRVVYGSR